MRILINRGDAETRRSKRLPPRLRASAVNPRRHAAALLLINVLLITDYCPAASVTLEWDPPFDTTNVTYLVEQFDSNGSLMSYPVGTNRIFTITNFFAGTNWFQARAVGQDGQISDPSNRASWPTNAVSLPKPNPPRQLRLQAVIQASPDVTGPWTNLATISWDGEPAGGLQFFRANLSLSGQ